MGFSSAECSVCFILWGSLSHMSSAYIVEEISLLLFSVMRFYSYYNFSI